MAGAGGLVTWFGLRELEAELTALPTSLQREADHIAEGAANGAATEIRSAYGAHVHSGNLQSHVLVEKLPEGNRVRITARHAKLFEYGTAARETKKTHANRGTMPAGNIAIPIMIRTRRQMFLDIIAMVQRYGLTVRQRAA